MESSPPLPHRLPVAVVGAGPVGLAAAAHLLARGLDPWVLEAGEGPGAHVAQWAHVRMFTPWRDNVDPLCRLLLEGSRWTPPAAEARPTGRELLEGYLQPLARTPELAPRILYGHRVTGIARANLDRGQSLGRAAAPFDLAFERAGGSGRLRARAVIDASGTWGQPRPLGAGGLPAIGERESRGRVLYRVPDVTGTASAAFAGRHVLVVGRGDSAFTVLDALHELGRAHPGTRVTWALRAPTLSFEGVASGIYPDCTALVARVEGQVREGRIEVLTGAHVREIVPVGARMTVGLEGRALPGVDAIVAATGFRPDHSVAGELRLALDPATESPLALGGRIDSVVHDCGSVPRQGIGELSHPDFGYFIVGMKSYGRAPTFLLRTGYEQVRSVVAALAADASGVAGASGVYS
jgi:cation diffusion facilitator CzcD-associated flavoprotein CzcO